MANSSRASSPSDSASDINCIILCPLSFIIFFYLYLLLQIRKNIKNVLSRPIPHPRVTLSIPPSSSPGLSSANIASQKLRHPPRRPDLPILHRRHNSLQSPSPAPILGLTKQTLPHLLLITERTPARTCAHIPRQIRHERFIECLWRTCGRKSICGAVAIGERFGSWVN